MNESQLSGETVGGGRPSTTAGALAKGYRPPASSPGERRQASEAATQATSALRPFSSGSPLYLSEVRRAGREREGGVVSVWTSVHPFAWRAGWLTGRPRDWRRRGARETTWSSSLPPAGRGRCWTTPGGAQVPLPFCPGGESGVPRSKVRKERPAWLRRGVRGGSEGVGRRRRGGLASRGCLGGEEAC